jgi:cytoskeletal protein CcmA (bactofilin family)
VGKVREKNMSDYQLKKIHEADIDTVLGEDIDFDGSLEFTNTLMIKGTFSGEIKASGDLYIEEKASVKAVIQAGRVCVKGVLQGDITADAQVKLFSSAIVEGDIISPDLVMESGCRFNGACTMRPAKGLRAGRGKKGSVEKNEQNVKTTPKVPEEKVEEQSLMKRGEG